MFEAVALAMLMPLKTVEPMTLLVDRQTGYVQAIDPRTPRRLAADEALTQSYLAQYVAAREGFDRATVSADYRKVALWSSGSARQAYMGQMPATNPESPFNRYPSGSLVLVAVKSVSALSPGVALVRFDTMIEDRDSRVDQKQPWVAVVRYRYFDAPMSMEDRLLNPLGFQVVGYRRDAEAPGAQITPPANTKDTAEEAPPSAIGVSRTPAEPTSVIVGNREVRLNQVPLGSPIAPSVGTNGGVQ